MKRLKGDRWITVEFKPGDLWIGIFWQRKRADYSTSRGSVIEELHVYVCLVPCLPIHYVSASKYAMRCICGNGVGRRYDRCDACGVKLISEADERLRDIRENV